MVGLSTSINIIKTVTLGHAQRPISKAILDLVMLTIMLPITAGEQHAHKISGRNEDPMRYCTREHICYNLSNNLSTFYPSHKM